ncbi:MAG: DUF551 domain-containing protein, partial [Aliidongia sp.]
MEWICIKDQFPPINTWCCVYDINIKGVYDAEYRERCPFYDHNGNFIIDKGFCSDSEYGNYTPLDEITHWMPYF